jgi:PAS domain S-box-containing protein
VHFLLPTHIATAKQTELQTVTLQLKSTHKFQFAGFYAAQLKGYYQKAGLKVIFKEGGPHINQLDEVLSGRADFCIGDADQLLDYMNGKPIVALGVIFQHAPDVIISRTASGITTPKELRGRKLMIKTTGAIPQWAMLADQGIKLKDLDLLPISNSIEALKEGKIDAISAKLTDQPYQLKRANVPINILHPATYGIDFYGDTLFAKQSFAKDNPKLVEAFINASFRGWEHAMSNPEELINVIRFKYNPNRTLGQLRHEADAMQALVTPNLVEVGTMSRKRWEEIGTTFRMLGLTSSNSSLDNFMYITMQQRRLIYIAHWTPYIVVIIVVVALATLFLFIHNRQLKLNVLLQNREVEHSRENLRQVVDLVPSLIYIKNMEGRFLLINQTMAESLGATVNDLTGKVHTEVHPDLKQAERMNEEDMAVIETGVPKVSMEEPYLHADGTTHWLQSTRLLFTMADSDEPAVLALSIDITNRRAAEAAIKEKEERFRAIFNQTYQFSGILSLDGDLIQVNESTLNVFNKTEAEVLNKPFRNAPWWSQDESTQTWLINTVRRATDGETIQDDILHILPDGTNINVDFTLKPARNDEGKIVFLIAEGRDITRLKESEDELRQLNEELEERVSERTKNLEKAKGELEASLDELHKTQEELILAEKLAALGGLVAGVAHEINTPLGVGVTASSFLEEKIKRMETKFETGNLKKSDLEGFIQTGRESCSTILSNLGRAAELIKSFKQVAADQSSEIPRQFNLRDYVDEVLVSLKPKFKRTGHVVENHCPDVTLYSYPGAFMQIITNLLVNSLTHAFEGTEHGRISIGGRVDDNMLTFTYDDDGCGIPPEEIDKVFEPFYTTKRGQGGTGLGLHIVFNTVTSTLDGTIRIESEVDGGTHFSIAMPMKQEETNPPHRAQS